MSRGTRDGFVTGIDVFSEVRSHLALNGVLTTLVRLLCGCCTAIDLIWSRVFPVRCAPRYSF